jgi:hypothetical protein
LVEVDAEEGWAEVEVEWDPVEVRVGVRRTLSKVLPNPSAKVLLEAGLDTVLEIDKSGDDTPEVGDEGFETLDGDDGICELLETVLESATCGKAAWN